MVYNPQIEMLRRCKSKRSSPQNETSLFGLPLYTKKRLKILLFLGRFS